jgi:ATP/maltotriose-dependent transcriptional regulator MalT
VVCRKRLSDEALHHALHASDMTAAVQIVARHRHELMNQAQWQRLDRWVRLFPREVINEQPDLLLIEVWLKFQPATAVRCRRLDDPAIPASRLRGSQTALGS